MSDEFVTKPPPIIKIDALQPWPPPPPPAKRFDPEVPHAWRLLRERLAELEKRARRLEEALKTLARPFNWDEYRGSLSPHFYWKGDGKPWDIAKSALADAAPLDEEDRQLLNESMADCYEESRREADSAPAPQEEK